MKSKWYPLIVIAITQMLVIIDNSVTFNALSGLVITFHSNVRSVQLVNSMYPLVAGAFMLAGGLIGLRIGWKRLLLFGLLFISAGELLAWLSPNLVVLTWGARVLAGIGGSLAIPAAIGLIPANYKGKEMAVAFGVLGGAVGIASSIGPILGGWIIDSYSWRTAYLMLAIAFGLGLLLAFALPNVKNPIPKFPFDFIGTVLFAIGIMLLTLGLVSINSWPIPMFLAFFIGGILFIALFVWYESKREKKNIPVLMPRDFFRSKGSRDGLVMTALTYFISGGLSFAMVTYLQVVKGFNALETGLIMSIYALGIILFSIGTPIVIKNLNPKRLCQIAIILAALSSAGIALSFNADFTLNAVFYISTFAFGAATGLLSSQSGVIVTSSIPQKYASLSGGMQGSMRNIGQAIGIALVGLIMVTALSQSMKKGIMKDPITHKMVLDHKIKLTRTIPYISNKELDKYLAKTDYGEAEKEEIRDTNNKGHQTALMISFGLFGLLILIFFLSTFHIPKNLAKSDETVPDPNSNPDPNPNSK